MKPKKKQPAAGDVRFEAPVDVTFEAAAGGKAVPRFKSVAYNGGPVRPHWYGYTDRPTVIDLAGVSAVGPIPVLLDHYPGDIIGQTSNVEIGTTSLTIEGIVTGNLDEDGPAKKVVDHAKNGFMWRASPGLNPTSIERVEGGEKATVNGRSIAGPVYVIRKSELREVSFLAMAADRTTSVKVAAKENPMDFSQWLTATFGMAEDDLTPEQVTKFRARFDAENSAGDDLDETPAPAKKKPKGKGGGRATATLSAGDDPLAEVKAKRARMTGIREMMATFGGEYPDAIEMIEEQGNAALADETYTVRDFENWCLRHAARGPAINNSLRTKSSQVVAQEEIEAGLCRAMGMAGPVLEKAFRPNTLEASNRRWRHGLSLRDMLEFTAKAHGYDGNMRSHPQEVLAAAMPSPQVRMGGGPSTYDVSGIVGGVLNLAVVNYFSSVDTAAMFKIAKTRPTSDFRQVENYALTSDMQFEQVAPGGELKHGTFGEEQYTNRVHTFGRILSIDRTTIINDDIGALNNIAQLMGRGGALALLHKFWTVFINNTGFFTSGRGNFDDGADSVLDLDGLAAAKTLFNKLTDPNGKPMNVSPRILLVPPELEATAKTILNSQLVVIAGDADRTIGNANIHAGTLDLAMARELSNSTYTGALATKWYILASPMELPTVEIAFLNGVQTPTIENAQADFDTLGIKMRGYFDFGVAMQEYRGGVAMKGA